MTGRRRGPAGGRVRACVDPPNRGTNRSRLSVPAAFNVGVFSASMDVRQCRLCARLDSAAISRMDAVHHVSSADIESLSILYISAPAHPQLGTCRALIAIARCCTGLAARVSSLASSVTV